MITLDELKVPKAARSYAEQVIAVTDELCLGHLDKEYADLCRRMVGKLARKRSAPLSRGNLRIWASGVVYAMGQINFLFDTQQELHSSAEDLRGLLGVKKSTMANKANMIRDLLKVNHFDAEFSRRDMIDANPLMWRLEVDGLMVDARTLPVPLQIRAFELRLIPYIPGTESSDD